MKKIKYVVYEYLFSAKKKLKIKAMSHHIDSMEYMHYKSKLTPTEFQITNFLEVSVFECWLCTMLLFLGVMFECIKMALVKQFCIGFICYL